ncbi:MFS transporter [Pseudomonas sp. REP124]|uniref:MFS transporter n=1 Tax=Pseudomonas sp. REP124 TaxID=2875731 RepID=UPI001CCD245A|nr:MFS transporter [Pseudomonas sp. REP124]MBZ9781481.1 MFS transporter [Pseudomonas sp. REP124]
MEHTHGLPNKRQSIAAVIGLLVLSIALRPAIISIGPILLLIQQQFNLTYAHAALLTSIPDVCMGLFALMVPNLARRFGIDRCVVVALILLGAATLLRALSPNAFFLLGSTFLASVGISIAGAMTGGWIKSHFPHRAALFMGIYAAGLSVGATLAAVFSAPIAELTESWRISAGVWSLLCVTAVASWIWMTKSFAAPPTAAKPRQTSAAGLPWRNMQAWWVALNFGAGQFVVYALFAWMAPAYLETAVSSLSPGALLGIFTAVFAVASVCAGLLPGKAHDRRALVGLSTMMATLGVAGMAFLPGWAPVLYVMLAAIGLGMGFTVAMTLPLDNTATVEQAGLWTVFMLFIGYLVAALGPLLFGALRDYTGHFAPAYSLLFVVLLLMLCITPLLKPAVDPLPQASFVRGS